MVEIQSWWLILVLTNVIATQTEIFGLFFLPLTFLYNIFHDMQLSLLVWLVIFACNVAGPYMRYVKFYFNGVR